MKHNKALKKKLLKLEQQIYKNQKTTNTINIEYLFEKIKTNPEQKDYGQLLHLMKYVPYFATKYGQKIDDVLEIDYSWDRDYRL